MKILVIDNYDSFTYNLVHLVEVISGARPDVLRNDALDMNAVNEYDALILSPGPGVPDEAGALKEVIRLFAPKKKILGVCLGHQAIGEVFGGKLKNLPRVYHGVETNIKITKPKHAMFKNIPPDMKIGRYHSWVIDNTSVPAELEILAVDDNNEIMAIRHKQYDVWGVQFHPESVMTPMGKQLVENWMKQKCA
ncbi:MAG: aminodeoxychorismate/anthranilate synthase component II [Chitinophagales bacterium]|nr:aminodeoxychorismate/anthranilate synthase component II [Chitinophagales bacterium]